MPSLRLAPEVETRASGAPHSPHLAIPASRLLAARVSVPLPLVSLGFFGAILSTRSHHSSAHRHRRGRLHPCTCRCPGTPRWMRAWSDDKDMQVGTFVLMLGGPLTIRRRIVPPARELPWPDAY